MLGINQDNNLIEFIEFFKMTQLVAFLVKFC